ncbi:MAG: DUF881 domain-containing protein [Nitriliruptorales bacterium]|nr:DUF881 domain-containing protein [Nitriliruptorales bacterium]
MTDLQDETVDEAAAGGPSTLVTRLAFGLTVGLLAAILVIAAQSDTTPASARSGRRVQLVELIHAEQARTQALEATVADLAAEVAAHEQQEAGGATTLAKVQRRIDRITGSAGLTEVRGPGITTVLTDSTLPTSPTDNLNDLVVHEQDLQAVTNALWAGGAEAVSVNGQRVLATTAIRCVGNTLMLHGVVYSPPYEIKAIGDEGALRAELDRDPAVQRFRSAVQEYKLGFAVIVDETLTIPAYEGATGVNVAQTARQTTE